MKLFFKILTVTAVVFCLLLTVGCKKDKTSNFTPDMPSQSISGEDGQINEDSVTADELLGIESNDATTSNPTTSNNTPSGDNSNNTSGTENSSQAETNSDLTTSKDPYTGFPTGNKGDIWV